MTTTHEQGSGSGHGHGHGHGHGAEQPDFSTMIDYLDLDGEVFSSYLAEATGAVRAAAPDAVRIAARIADLGCGTGTATLALARLFPEATLTPVDVQQALLDHLMAKADAAGVADRITPVVADLDAGWPEQLHDLDVVWASTSIHHLADPVAGLRSVRSALVPGGLLALVEVDDLDRFHPAFLPDESERRLRAGLADDWRAMMPLLGADWTAVLADAGFEVVEDKVFDVALLPPLPAELVVPAQRFAELSLQRVREGLESTGRAADVDPADLAGLDAVLAEGLAGRTDLMPRTRRRLYLARPA